MNAKRPPEKRERKPSKARQVRACNLPPMSRENRQHTLAPKKASSLERREGGVKRRMNGTITHRRPHPAAEWLFQRTKCQLPSAVIPARCAA